MSAQRRNNEQLAVYTRQANILRKNLTEWDRMLRTPRGEDWPTMVGRLNAASVRMALNMEGPSIKAPTLRRTFDNDSQTAVHRTKLELWTVVLMMS